MMQAETIFVCHYNNIWLRTGFRAWRKRCKEVLWVSPRGSWYVYLKRADIYLKRGSRDFGFHWCSQLLFLVGLDKSTLSLASSLICKERAKYLLFSLMRRFCVFLGPSCPAVGLALLVSGILRDGLTQPRMTLLEKCLLHEVPSTSDSLLGKEHHEISFSLRPGKCNRWCEPALGCECHHVCLSACRGAMPSKLQSWSLCWAYGGLLLKRTLAI